MTKQHVRQKLNEATCIASALFPSDEQLYIEPPKNIIASTGILGIELSPLEVDDGAADITGEIANKLCQTIERNGGAELANISHIFVGGGFGCSPVFLNGLRRWKEYSANTHIRSATLITSIEQRMEVSKGLVDMLRSDFSFADCTLTLKSCSGGSTDLVKIHGGYQPFQKRVKCDKDTTFKVMCTRTPKNDTMGNPLGLSYEVSGVEVEVPKTSIFGKGMKISGVASAEGITLSY